MKSCTILRACFEIVFDGDLCQPFISRCNAVSQYSTQTKNTHTSLVHTKEK